MRNDYLVTYLAFDSSNMVIKKGTVRCKNRLSAFDAQAGLERHFEKTLSGFTRLLVTSCHIETSFLDDILNLMYKK